MAKILGVREVAHGTGQLPAILQKAQKVSLMGSPPAESKSSLVAAILVLAAAGSLGWVIYSVRES